MKIDNPTARVSNSGKAVALEQDSKREETTRDKRTGAVDRRSRITIIKSGATIMILIVMVVVFSILSPEFRMGVNFFNIFDQNAVIGIIACGMAFMLIIGGFDLSVGSTAALTGVVVALILRGNPNAFLVAVVCGLAIGAAVGLINGLFIAKVGINPFVTTLGTMVIIRGLVYAATHGQAIYGFPMHYNVIGMGKIGPVPVNMIIWAWIIFFSHIVLKYSKFGQYVYAVGGNENVARLSGINVERMKILTALLCGILASVGGIVLVFRVMAALPQAGNMYEMFAIAAAVVGGCVLGGGRGGVLGTVTGALILGVIINGLHMLGVSAYWEYAVTGMIILAAVTIEVVTRRMGGKG